MNIAEHNVHIKSEYNRKRDKFISPHSKLYPTRARQEKYQHIKDIFKYNLIKLGLEINRSLSDFTKKR